MAVLTGHKDKITSLVFDDKTSSLYSCSWDSSINIYDLSGENYN